MAKTLSKINVETGEVVEAHHISQSIDAFTGTEAYDIELSGSFTVTGSTNLENLNINNVYNLPTVDGTASQVLNTDGAGNVTWGDVSYSHGRILYVSSNGNDSQAQIGNVTKPYATLKAAKDASISGDTIHVFPQTITFDNSNAAGNPYNGVWETEVNLWKDGVTYYFEAGCKINMINETVAGQDMGLFYPVNAGETCTVLGYLEFTFTGLGSDSSNGKSVYLKGENEGFTFHSETKLLKSTSCDLIDLDPLSNTVKTTVTIISEYEEKTYTAGNSGSGSSYIILGSSGNAGVDFTSIVKNRYYSGKAYSFYLRGDLSTSTINIGGEYMRSDIQVLLLRQLVCNSININIKDIYYTNSFTTFGYSGAIISTSTSGGWILNMESNLHDYTDNTLTSGLFWINHSGNVLNFKGNITTRTTSGTGRFIVSASTGNIVNIESNINLAGSGTTSNVIMQSFGTSVVNFTGKILGNFNYTFHPRQGGEININNSQIESTASNFTLYDHTDTTVSTIRFKNSNITALNDLNTFTDGQYLNTLISNCNIINSGDGNTFSNLTNSGVLQILDSSIFSQLGLSIDYNTTTTVISSNTTVNTNYSISDLKGGITLLTDLIK